MKTLQLFAMLRDIAGAKTIDVPFQDGQDCHQLLADIRTVAPELADYMIEDNGELTGTVHILVHGRHIQWLNGLDTTIKQDDVVTLLPPSAGG